MNYLDDFTGLFNKIFKGVNPDNNEIIKLSGTNKSNTTSTAFHESVPQSLIDPYGGMYMSLDNSYFPSFYPPIFNPVSIIPTEEIEYDFKGKKTYHMKEGRIVIKKEEKLNVTSDNEDELINLSRRIPSIPEGVTQKTNDSAPKLVPTVTMEIDKEGQKTFLEKDDKVIVEKKSLTDSSQNEKLIEDTDGASFTGPIIVILGTIIIAGYALSR